MLKRNKLYPSYEMKDPKTIAAWLDKLQQESWNLELLVSGFAIFLLVQVESRLNSYLNYLDQFFNFDANLETLIEVFLGLTYLCCLALIIFLVIHILLRGFWIGTIGLRSVQPKVNYRKLRYNSRFEGYLFDRLPGLDQLLIRLDQISSALFSFSFLIIFMLLSVGAWFLFITLLNILFNSIFLSLPQESIAYQVLTIFIYLFSGIFILATLLYVFDTLSIGLVKRSRRLRPLYLPVYRFFTTITGAFLYRSIYYHLVSYLGIWPSRILLNLFILTMILAPFNRITHSVFFPDNDNPSKLDRYVYDDLRPEKGFIWQATIPSTLIRDNNLPLFIRYRPHTNEDLRRHCTDYTPSKDQAFISGISFEKFALNIDEPLVAEKSPDSLLQCLSSFYRIYINDSLYRDPDFLFLEHPNRNEPGIYSVLDISDLPAGAHRLRIDQHYWSTKRDSFLWSEWIVIPFWKAAND